MSGSDGTEDASPRQRAREVLERSFGYHTFKAGQEEVITHLLEGRSAAAVFPTGGGKSLCYQLPAVLLEGLTLVVSPLIALMKDQIDALATRGIPAVRLDSSLDKDAYRDAMDGIRSGRTRLVYVAPERFNNERFRDFLGSRRIALFAVDEAHCISEWGHNFRPDYLKLAEFARAADAERIFALTATATPKVLEEVCRLFDIDPACAVQAEFYRPNLSLHVRNVTSAERDDLIEAELGARPPGPTIVYVTVQRTAESVAARLAASGRPARPYHAGMDADERSRTQDWFLQSGDGIVVATIAFGMGIDKPDIRYVHHYNLSKSLESYSQEIGRAGRDGEPSRCVTFYCPEDLTTLQNFAYGDTPTESGVLRLIQEVFEQADTFDIGVHGLSAASDIRMLVVRTLLVYLELDGYLEGGTPIYSSFRFQPHSPSSEILATFDAERRAFVANVFRQAKKGRTWFTVDATSAAQALGVDRMLIIRALEQLSDDGHLTLEAQGVRHRYSILRRPDDQAELASMLYGRLLDRELREVGRLHSMVETLQAESCLVNALGEHFGEFRPTPCGHCTVCLGEDRGPLPFDANQDPEAWPDVTPLIAAHADVLGEPRALARFLCGVPSPAITKARLKRHELFGSLRGVPFPRVVAEYDSPVQRQLLLPATTIRNPHVAP